MRLWHQSLLPVLPGRQLLGQHREICALRGNGWGKRHKTVDYVFKYDRRKLYDFHLLVMGEMERRGYSVRDENWRDPRYRGKNAEADRESGPERDYAGNIYEEHDADYLQACLDNLKNKGVFLTEKSVFFMKTLKLL